MTKLQNEIKNRFLIILAAWSNKLICIHTIAHTGQVACLAIAHTGQVACLTIAHTGQVACLAIVLEAKELDTTAGQQLEQKETVRMS